MLCFENKFKMIDDYASSSSSSESEQEEGKVVKVKAVFKKNEKKQEMLVKRKKQRYESHPAKEVENDGKSGLFDFGKKKKKKAMIVADIDESNDGRDSFIPMQLMTKRSNLPVEI